MARRQRSFSVKANRDNFWKTVDNNIAASIEKGERERKKKAAQAASAEKKRQARWAREKKEKERKAAVEARRVAREKEKLRKEKEKLDKKIDTLVQRFKLECENKEILYARSVALEVASEAVSTKITVAQLKKYFIEGKEDAIQKRAIEYHLLDLVEKNLKGMESANFYLDSPEGKNIQRLINDLGMDIKSREHIRKNKEFAVFIESVVEQEKKALYWHEQNLQISARLDSIFQDRHLLPDDIEKLQDFVESQNELTFDAFLGCEIYREGLNNKKALLSEVEKKFDALMGK